jgi:hypothetical protein
MTRIAIVLEFDTEDTDAGEVLNWDELAQYAEDLNLDVARSMVGYQGWWIDSRGSAPAPHDA